MLSELTSAQLAEWMAFHELEPWGGPREDLRAGTVAAAVCNAAPFRGKGAKALRPADFFDTLKGGPSRQPAKDQAEHLLSMTRRMRGKVITIRRG